MRFHIARSIIAVSLVLGSASALVVSPALAQSGSTTRAQVKMDRNKFLSMNTWDQTHSTWVPVSGAPRDMSKLTRAQLKAETVIFLKMYRFDESTSSWVSKNR